MVEMDLPVLLGSIVGFAVVIMIVTAPLIAIALYIRKKIRRRKLKGYDGKP